VTSSYSSLAYLTCSPGDGLVPARDPFGAWSIVPILALAGVLVSGIVRFMRPARTAAVAHIIDSVAAHDGGLEQRNAVMTVAAVAFG